MLQGLQERKEALQENRRGRKGRSHVKPLANGATVTATQLPVQTAPREVGAKPPISQRWAPLPLGSLLAPSRLLFPCLKSRGSLASPRTSLLHVSLRGAPWLLPACHRSLSPRATCTDPTAVPGPAPHLTLVTLEASWTVRYWCRSQRSCSQTCSRCSSLCRRTRIKGVMAPMTACLSWRGSGEAQRQRLKVCPAHRAEGQGREVFPTPHPPPCLPKCPGLQLLPRREPPAPGTEPGWGLLQPARWAQTEAQAQGTSLLPSPAGKAALLTSSSWQSSKVLATEHNTWERLS